MSDTTLVERDTHMVVEVWDPDHQASCLLESVRPTATAAEIRKRAQNELPLPADVDWNLRDERTGRLLQDAQQLRDFAPLGSPHIQLTLQPDAGLG
jgi:hypothetical protein